MKKKFISRRSRIFPTSGSRSFHRARNANYPVSRFETYNDWFYFIHVDPYLRWIHALGMVTGLFFFVLSFYRYWILGIDLRVGGLFLAGVFFFYFLPLLSHFYYDGGSAKSSPDRFHSTLIPVIHINLLTLTGNYDQWLRGFIDKYPFTVAAWELEEHDA